MNRYQERWWREARSDLAVSILLRRQGAAACHQLHYLQMVTEKLGKAYFWRSGTPPPRSHASFVQFMRFLGAVRGEDRRQLAGMFAFNRFRDFQNWIRAVLPIAYELERLAPSLAHDGPNPEYPWPREAPEISPVEFDFDLWRQIAETARGRSLLQMIEIAVEKFPVYG